MITYNILHKIYHKIGQNSLSYQALGVYHYTKEAEAFQTIGTYQLQVLCYSVCEEEQSDKSSNCSSLREVLQTEIAAVSSDDFESLTRDKSKEALLNFEKVVATINDEMKCKAPTVLAILMACLKPKSPELIQTELLLLFFQ